MKVELDGYVIKISFWGDNITPMYRYEIYEPEKVLWFKRNRHVHTVNFHRSELIEDSVRDTCPKALEDYKDSIGRWL